MTDKAGQSVPESVCIANELRLAKDYWLKTIQPHIASRRLAGAELYIANNAYERLRHAAKQATEWNNTKDAERSPVPAEVFPEWEKDEFREPKLLSREKLEPGILAAIAASMMQKRTAELTSIEVIRVAHELLMDAERYVETLPEKKQGEEALRQLAGIAFSPVTFAEIERSNRNNSGKLPLLQPVGRKRKGRKKGEMAEKPLSLTAIKNAVKKFLRKQCERDRKQSGTKQISYQEWQNREQGRFNDLLNNQIGVHDLCTLRWERFSDKSENQSQIAATREQKKRDRHR
jgi:hypothetical protein